jgi:autotransporter translocation and assembly factor TamB
MALSLVEKARYQAKLGGKGPVSGDLAELHLEQALAAPVSGQLTATVFGLEQVPSWDALLQLDDADVAAFTQDFPARLKGRIGSSGNLENIQISAKLNLSESSLGELAVELQSQYAGGMFKAERLLLTTAAGVRVEGQGHYRADAGADTLAVDLSWRDLRWPLSGQAVQFRSAQGELNVTGHPSDYRYRLNLETAVPDLPPAQVDSSGTGNLEGLPGRFQRNRQPGGPEPGRTGHRPVRRPHPGKWTGELVAGTGLAGAVKWRGIESCIVRCQFPRQALPGPDE